MAVGVIALFGFGLIPAAASAGSQTFSYTGGPQSYTVPASTDTIVVEAFGAQGGGGYTNGSPRIVPGGLGGESIAQIPLTTTNRTLQINVGGAGSTGVDPDSCNQNGANNNGAGGFNGGGNTVAGEGGGMDFCSASGAGGGATDIRIGSFGLADRILVAGGGGGAGVGGGGLSDADEIFSYACLGGTGGGSSGSDAESDGNCNRAGKGASSSGGGEGSNGGGENGTLGTGGSSTPNDSQQAGGGGGGGFYGGGAGGPSGSVSVSAGAGGGGSGFIPASSATTTNGVNDGNGRLTITSIGIGPVIAAQTKVVPGESFHANGSIELYNPTGQLSFDLYGPQDPTCSGTPAFHDPQTVGSASSFQSADFAAQLSGTYRWVVTYPGDTYNPALTTGCAGTGNVVTVAPHPPTALTAPPSTNNLNPHISGTVFAGSNVSLYTTSDCSGTPKATGTAADFASPGFPVAVTPNSTTTFYATATLDGATSLCSTSSATYVNDSTPPVASIQTQVPAISRSDSASFTYSSNKPGSVFQCRLGSQGFEPCPTEGITYSGISDGTYTFYLKAVDPAGNVSQPTSFSWTVDTIKPQGAIEARPPVNSNSVNASFTYGSSKPDSTFECSLDSQAFAACPSGGMTYSGMASTSHTFRIRATDSLGLTGPEDSFTWTIDTTPPQSAIFSGPPALSDSPTTAFQYLSLEPGSTFECQLDSGDYSSCPAAGTGYSGLTNGSHTFNVRATDQAGNVGPVSTWTWTVDLPWAEISKVSTSGPATATRGRRVTFGVRIKNTGNATATDVNIQVTGNGIKTVVPAGKVHSQWTKRIAVTVRPKHRGRITLKFKVTSSNAGSDTASRALTVLGTRRPGAGR